MFAFDLQGTQSLDHRDRGVARYVRELALGLERLDPAAVGMYVLNPDLPSPGGIEPLIASGKVRFSDEVDWSSVGALHVASPYELSVPGPRVIPPGWHGRLIVTLFDLVSEVLADDYLADPGLRRRYRARHELVRQADLVLAISASAADDGARLLGLRRERIVVTPLAPSASFVPWTGEREPYVLYTGGTDHRKNVEGLLAAWGRLPSRVRDRYRLVIVGKVDDPTRNHYEVTAQRLGFARGLHVTGWVPEDELVRLTQRASLAVFPALYEGYGLPVAEALACGTPAIASNTSSLPELLPPDALFDPHDVDAIASAIDRALAKPPRVDWPRRTWDDVARETLAAYATTFWARSAQHAGLSAPKTEKEGRRRVAVVTPLPPVPGGVSRYSHRLLEALAKVAGEDGVEVHAFVDGPPHEREAIERASASADAEAPAGVHVHKLGAFERIEAIEGEYDGLVVTLGNSEYHTGALDLLLRRAGNGNTVVLAHDVRLTGLHRFAAWQHPGATPGGFHTTLHRMYGGGLPDALGEGGQIDANDAERWGVLMARDAIAASGRYLVTSPFAAELARLDARTPTDRHKIAAVPFAVAAAGAGDVADRPRTEQRPPVVASFGLVDALKQPDLLAEAMAIVRKTHAGARLVFVGPCALDDVRGAEVTGRVSDDEYRRWLDTASVAVQLRAATNGESSAAVGDCLAAGVPTVVTGIGAARDIPDGAVRKVSVNVTPNELAAVITELVDDVATRRKMSDAARAYAREHTFEAAAAAIYRVLFESG